MGPTLLDLYNFTEGFDKLTIVNIFSNLLQKIKYISGNNIVHHDIKPENIAWGVIRKSEILNPEEFYLIDYGLSLNFNKKTKEDSIDEINYGKGTLKYMSINSHLNIKPSALDDVENLLYTCLFLAKIPLPWENINCFNFDKNKIILEMKKNFRIYDYCGRNYNFLSQIYFYLEKIRANNSEIDFDVVEEFLRIEKESMAIKSNYARKYIFLDEIIVKLNEFKISGKAVPEDKKLRKLFENYPIDFRIYYNSLI